MTDQGRLDVYVNAQPARRYPDKVGATLTWLDPQTGDMRIVNLSKPYSFRKAERVAKRIKEAHNVQAVALVSADNLTLAVF